MNGLCFLLKDISEKFKCMSADVDADVQKPE